MKSQTPNSRSKLSSGLTIVELLVVFALLSILVVAAFIYVNPAPFRAKGRDNKRLSDLSALDRVVNEFFTDNSRYPDLATDDLSVYINKIPVDPINDGTYFYTYQTSGNSYEINAALEYLTDEMQNDGGNQPDKYELGNNLTLLY